MGRAYLRLDPGFFDRKVIDQKYPPGAVAALIGALCHAEHQPQRGRFRDERVLRSLLGPVSRWLPYLIEKRDLVKVRGRGGELYVDGWDEWQEGDWKVGERVARIRNRQGTADAGPTPGAQRTANWRLRTRVFERDNFTCRYCGIADYPRDWLILEHADPDGPSDETNLVTACRSCNKLKGNRTPEQAGMPLRDTSPRDGVTHGSDASPTESLVTGDVLSRRQSVIDSGSSSGGVSESPLLVESDLDARDDVADVFGAATTTRDRKNGLEKTGAILPRVVGGGRR
jgi:HNH endonuclease